MLHRSTADVPPAVTDREQAELAAARRRHVELLARADQAIRSAMAHADEVFLPDRRRKPR